MIYFDRGYLKNSEMNIFFWGVGQVAKTINDRFKEHIEEMNICGFIDNDETKHNTKFGEYEIYSPNILKDKVNCFVIILCNDGRKIVQQINEEYRENVIKCEDFHYFIKYRLLDRYSGVLTDDVHAIVEYISDRSLQTFNYSFVEKYKTDEIYVGYDESNSLFYSYLCGKKIYLCRRFKNVEQVKKYLREIFVEQDKESPHCYLGSNSIVAKGDVVVDAGAAEGNFSLSVIDYAKKVIIIEPDDEWVEALKYTFAPYKDKVMIINKYLSNYESKETITLDKVCDSPIDYIKMDIEGEELNALRGGVNIIMNSAHLTCAVCTYHNEFDYDLINDWFLKKNMKVEPTKGYMWFSYDKEYMYSLPSLRRGMIIAKKG